MYTVSFNSIIFFSNLLFFIIKVYTALSKFRKITRFDSGDLKLWEAVCNVQKFTELLFELIDQLLPVLNSRRLSRALLPVFRRFHSEPTAFVSMS